MALAAALLEKCARLSSAHWPDAPGALDRAHALRLHSEELVEQDINAYLAFVGAMRSQTDVDAARSSTVDVPLDIARAAVEVGELAEQLAGHGNPNLRPDAVVAAILSGGAAESAALLVAANLEGAGDARLEEARSLAAAASARGRRLSARGPRGRARGRSRDTGPC